VNAKKEILKEYVNEFSFPTALLNEAGNLQFFNIRLSRFLRESLKTGDNLISLLKKKALK